MDWFLELWAWLISTFVSNALPRNRFAQILSNIHVNDNAAIPNNNTDKLYKLRPMINQLNWNFVKLYNVSIMLAWWKHDIVQRSECYKAIQSNETNKKGFQTAVIGWYGWLFVPLRSLSRKEPSFCWWFNAQVFWLSSIHSTPTYETSTWQAPSGFHW